MISQSLKKEGHTIYWLFAFLYWEILTHAAMYEQFQFGFRFALAFGCAVALILSLVLGFLPRRILLPIDLLLTVVVTLVYGSQMVYNFIFGTPYSVAQMGLGAGAVSQFWRETLTTMTENWPWIAALLVPLVVLIVYVNDAERRIPIQYAKRVVGRKVYGGQNTNLPIKVAMSGVMPVIFAQSICSMPATIATFVGKNADNSWWYANVFGSDTWIYAVMYGLMIFFFSWFYSTIQYDPVEIANNLKKNGGFIPGFRPGKPTAEFIQKVINKIVVFGAIYLGVVALLPIVAGNLMAGVRNLAIGGTSVIIIVGVALETVKALEAQMMMRHYKGFLD